jgi:hypothetical protein
VDHKRFSATGQKCAKGRGNGCWLYELRIADHYLSGRIILAKERLHFGAKEELKRGRMDTLFRFVCLFVGTTAIGSMRKFDEDFPAKATPWATI